MSERDAKERTVTITMTLEQAKDWRAGLADILCWTRGFCAACPEDTSRHPLGVFEAQELSLRLRDAINLADKEPF